MSIFLCAKCDNLRDSDDGCEEYGPNFGLMCSDCMDEREDEESAPAPDMSYGRIYHKLLEMGCDPDMAHELAREKSR